MASQRPPIPSPVQHLAQASTNQSFPAAWSWLKPDWRILLSAILVVAAFPPWGLSLLIWIALVPWFWSIRRLTKFKQAVAQGIWLSFFITVFGFFWIASVLHQFGNLPWVLSIIGLLLFSLVGQPQLILFTPFLFAIERRKQQGQAFFSSMPLQRAVLALALAFAYCGLDWILPKLFVDTFGHSLYAQQHLRQVADLGGATLLTMIIYLVNHVLWELFSPLLSVSKKNPEQAKPAALFKSRLRTELPSSALAVLLVLSSLLYGFHRHHQIQEALIAAKSHIQIGVIQANIGDFDKLAAENGVRQAGEKILDTFFSMSDSAMAMNPKPDALVWPETSYPSTFRTPQTPTEFARDQRLIRYVRNIRVPILFGGYDQADGKDFNSFFFLYPNRVPGLPGEGDMQVYHKNILLLFGEYIPGAESIQLLKDWFPQVGNFGRGTGPEVFDIPISNSPLGNVRISPVICYEVLFPNYVISAARNNSQMILNITNDSWFGPIGEPQLHLALSIFRSIETRLPQVRSTNTGISTLILPDGEITQPSQLFQPEIINLSVPLIQPPRTLMVAWGDWFGPTAFVLGFAFLGGAWFYYRRRETASITLTL